MSGRSAGLWIGLALSFGLGGCIEHRVRTEPIEVEPIHVTVDINYRVDRRLEEFFEFQKERRDRPPDTPARPEGEPPERPQQERPPQSPRGRDDGRRLERWPPAPPGAGSGDALE